MSGKAKKGKTLNAHLTGGGGKVFSFPVLICSFCRIHGFSSQGTTCQAVPCFLYSAFQKKRVSSVLHVNVVSVFITAKCHCTVSVIASFPFPSLFSDRLFVFSAAAAATACFQCRPANVDCSLLPFAKALLPPFFMLSFKHRLSLQQPLQRRH